MKRTVIVHHEDGVFVGVSMGLAFFSFQDNAGQVVATTFKDEADARDFVRKIQDRVGNLKDTTNAKSVDWWDPDGFRYISVDSADGKGASYKELCRAGLEREAATLNPLMQGLEGGHG